MNKSDSERLATGLEELGLQENSDLESSDVIVLNTCVVRQSAEDTATGLLGKLKKIKRVKPEVVVAVMGCMVGPTSKTLSRRFPHVDAWARPQEFEKILEPVSQFVDNDISGCAPVLVPDKPKVATFIPIIHGCDKFCSFCIIPYRRGREKSRTISEIFEETRLLVDRGVKEVTLLGQNVDSYGHDLEPQCDLADLFYSIHDIEGLERIRFLTSHPNDMSIKIIEAIRDLPKVCESINLPFQAGDNEILKVMRRGYSREEYFDKVNLIKETIPIPSNSDIEIATIKEGYIAVIKYSGRSSDKNFLKYSEILYQKLLEDQILIKGSAIKATYNGPFTLPPFRRNEVMFNVDWKN